MKKITFLILIFFLIIAGVSYYYYFKKQDFSKGQDSNSQESLAGILPNPNLVSGVNDNVNKNINSNNKTEEEIMGNNQNNNFEEKNALVEETKDMFISPIDRPIERANKKKFGMFIAPESSPVQPERFRGYHTGVDLEAFPDELEKDVPVKAVCDGKLLSKRTASGYGGVAVQECELERKPITIVYGHLKLESVTPVAGEDIKAGTVIGFLGADKSSETDGERKHLHLSFHKGPEIDIKGYVQSQKELSNWLDPCLYICKE